jgi:thioredoxin-related protein
MKTCISLLIALLLGTGRLMAQNTQFVRWTAFEALEDSLKRKKKPVVLYFHTDWCTYCRKMDKQVFTQEEVAGLLNEHYYAVKMDAETTDTIYFEGQAFVNYSAKHKREGIHEMAQIFSRETGFVAPTFVVLNEDFRVQAARYEYLHSERLKEILTQSW